MLKLRTLAGRFASDTQGATAIEYALLAVLIAVGAIGGMQALGGGLGKLGQHGPAGQRRHDTLGTLRAGSAAGYLSARRLAG
jgi:Flp pilus assembly pilin Flp